MPEGRFTDEEKQRIILLRAQGRTFKEIGQTLGRHASSVCRYITGERGSVHRYQKKPWRCPSCGGLQNRSECLGCELQRQRENTPERRNKQSAVEWHSQIKQRIQRRRAARQNQRFYG